MKAYSGLAFIVGAATIVLLGIAVGIALDRDDDKHDERQKRIIGRSLRIGHPILMLMIIVDIIFMELAGKDMPFDTSFLILATVFAGESFIAGYQIMKGVFFGMERHPMWDVIFLWIFGLQCMFFYGGTSSAMQAFQSGRKLTAAQSTFFLGICLVILAILATVRWIYDRKCEAA